MTAENDGPKVEPLTLADALELLKDGQLVFVPSPGAKLPEGGA